MLQQPVHFKAPQRNELLGGGNGARFGPSDGTLGAKEIKANSRYYPADAIVPRH
jgi:hypothetical protein